MTLPKPTRAGGEVELALHRMAREDSGRVLALLTRRFGDLDLADDAVQEALIEAAQVWPERGVPSNPAGWLLTVARRKAIDMIRRADSRRRRTRSALDDPAADRAADEPGRDDDTMVEHDGRIADERLRLMFLCCHPAIGQDAQVALTLRLVGGLTTAEIAAAFVVSEPTLAQRIVRAKQKIRGALIPMTIPASLDERIDAVLAVLYLTFNEGYLARGAQATELQRIDLATEAIRLTEVLVGLVPGHPEADGLLALQLFVHARAGARVDASGDLVLLEDQDRATWDRAMIARANRVLAAALRRVRPGPYQLQAVIAAHHANAPAAGDTDWPAIATAYRQLAAMTGSPVVALNHAVAVAMADGPAAGLSLLQGIVGLDDYQHFHSARADLLRRLGRTDDAAVSYRLALGLTDNASERRFLQRRLADVLR